jgi:microfibrillar-associated protein 1
VVHRRARETIAIREAEALESEEAIRKQELEAEERRKQSHDMVAESIKRELAESKKHHTDQYHHSYDAFQRGDGGAYT